MALTLSQHLLLSQLVHGVENMRRDFRANAASYVARINADPSVVEAVADVATRDAEAYLRILQRVRLKFDNGGEAEADFNALVSEGAIAGASVRAELVAFWSAAVAQRDAPKTTVAEIQAMAAATIAAIPAAQRLW